MKDSKESLDFEGSISIEAGDGKVDILKNGILPDQNRQVRSTSTGCKACSSVSLESLFKKKGESDHCESCIYDTTKCRQVGGNFPVERVPEYPTNRFVTETGKRYNPNFPTERRVIRLELDRTTSEEAINSWFTDSGVTIGPGVGAKETEKVKRLLYTYREINASSLGEVPCTDLWIHRARVPKDAIPTADNSVRRYTPEKRYWLDHTVHEGLEFGLFERTVLANNGHLSSWNSHPHLVKKSTESKAARGEYRVTFDYSKIKEDIPGCTIVTTDECHDYLSHPTHHLYHQLDLKHAYWSVAVHPEDRHYYTFSAPGFGQLQPTRMPQGAGSSAFTMNELMSLVLGPIPPNSDGQGAEPSLLQAAEPDTLPGMVYYMDDMMAASNNFEEAFRFLEHHLLPRLLWSKLRLSFKKCSLFMTEIVALGVLHRAGVGKTIKPDRVCKIRAYPVPQNKTGVRGFLGTIGITRKWVKNFAEISRPLTRLTGDVPWRWSEPEQLAFDTLKLFCSNVLDLYGWSPEIPISMYTDASSYGAGCCVTQKVDGEKVEVPILFDSFTLTKTQRAYSTYKRELLAMIEFSRRYSHMLACRESSVIYTDHQPLVYFLRSSSHEGIYARWASELRLLNLRIEYIPGKRNKVADALSRTIFPGDDCDLSDYSHYGQVTDTIGGPKWVWKDGKGGYEQMLKNIAEPIRSEELESFMTTKDGALWLVDGKEFSDKQVAAKAAITGSGEEIDPFMLENISRHPRASVNHQTVVDSAYGDHPSFFFLSKHPDFLRMACNRGYKAAMVSVDQGERPSPDETPNYEVYRNSKWYGIYLEYLVKKKCQPGSQMQKRSFLEKCSRYKWEYECMWYRQADTWRICLLEQQVSKALYKAHDEGGHFAVAITMKKLRNVYWPTMLSDTQSYILGCLTCAKYGPKQRSQPLSKVLVTRPMELMGADFCGPFQYVPERWRYLLVVIDYFSRYVWVYGCCTASSQEVVRCLRDLFQKEGSPIGFYVDSGSHFERQVREFAASKGVLWINSPVASKKSTGMAEKAVHIVQQALARSSPNPSMTFHQHLTDVIWELNTREMNLGYSPFNIQRGYQPRSSVDLAFPAYFAKVIHDTLTTDGFPEEMWGADGVELEEWGNAVLGFVDEREAKIRKFSRVQDAQRDQTKALHDAKNKSKLKILQPGALVMLYDHTVAGQKMKPSWRGPFVVVELAGEHQRSYRLRQVNGAPIMRKFHIDQLKEFKLRMGYLTNGIEENLPVYQNLRAGQSLHSLPRALRRNSRSRGETNHHEACTDSGGLG